MNPRSLILPTIAAIVVAAAALVFKPSSPAMSSAKTAAVVSSKTAHIKIANYDYAPMSLTVRVGTKIVVTNKDQTAHTLTARTGNAFDSGTINPGKTKTFTVKKPGVYHYYCQFHAFMAGTLTVVK